MESSVTDAGQIGGVPDGIRVLVTGGSAANLHILSEMLSGGRMEMVEAEGAEPALAAVRDASHARRPFAVVILETTLLGDAGLKLAQSLRQTACGSAVIVVTSQADLKEAKEYRAAGARAYLQQPVTEADLMKAISAALASESLERLSAFSNSVQTVVQPLDGVGNVSIIKALAPEIGFDDGMFENDPQFLAEIVSLFLKTYPPLLDAIEDAISGQDALALRKAAHSLKGAVANFGAKAVVEQAAALESIGRDGNFSEAAERGAALRNLMCKFEPELHAALKRAMEQVAM